MGAHTSRSYPNTRALLSPISVLVLAGLFRRCENGAIARNSGAVVAAAMDRRGRAAYVGTRGAVQSYHWHPWGTVSKAGGAVALLGRATARLTGQRTMAHRIIAVDASTLFCIHALRQQPALCALYAYISVYGTVYRFQFLGGKLTLFCIHALRNQGCLGGT